MQPILQTDIHFNPTYLSPDPISFVSMCEWTSLHSFDTEITPLY